MDKKEVARILEEIAILLEMQGENPFRIKAYRNGAHLRCSLWKKSLFPHAKSAWRCISSCFGKNEPIA